MPDTFTFIANPDADYRYDFEKIAADLRQFAAGDPKKFLQFGRFWCQESLFFLLYFILKVPVNHPWLVDRINDVQDCNDRTLDLWARESFKCLQRDSVIWMADGTTKRLEDVVPGDWVLGYSDAVSTPVSVIAKSEPMERYCYSIRLRSNRKCVCTPDHRFLTVHGLETAEELNEGDFIAVPPLESNELAPVKVHWDVIAEKSPAGQQIVYDIQVGGDSLFIANGIVTHNSTIITYGLNIQEILRDPNVRIGIFSHTRSIAKAFLRRIKVTFEDNELLKSLFPDILYKKPSSESAKWSEDDGLLVKRPSVYQESTVEAHGLVDSQPTSRHFSVLNYDDVVTVESVSTSEQIRKVDERFRLSLNLGTANGKRRVIGTSYHFADQYEKLKQQGGWIVRIHPAIGPDGKPVLLSEERIAELRRELGPYVFSCQQLLNPIAERDQRFKNEWLRYYRQLPDHLSLYLVCDPANEKKQRLANSDYSVFWLWGWDSNDNLFLVDVIRDRFTLTERWKALKRLVKKYPKIQRIGYEQYGMAADIQHFEEMMRTEGFYFNIIELAGNKLSKNDRIARLIPLFEQGRVYLPERLEYETKDGEVVDLVKVFIEEEYSRFPFSRHDDMLDAASRIEDKALDACKPYDDWDDTFEGVHDIGGFFNQPGRADPGGRDEWTGY